MSPYSNRAYEYIASNWKKTNLMLGMSWQFRGATIFLHNIICDLQKRSDDRLNFLERASGKQAFAAEAVVTDFQESEESNYYYYSLDVRRQDASVNSCQIDSYFAFARSCWWVPDSLRRKFGRVFKWQRDFMVHTPIALPDGQIVYKHKGNVSGSPHTTLINTYCVEEAIYALVAAVWGSSALDDVVMRVYGDNVLLVVPKSLSRKVSVEELSECLECLIGQELNPDESYVSDHLIHEIGMEGRDSAQFLSKHFGRNGLVWRPAIETIMSMVDPEARELSNGERYARAVGLMLDNPYNIEAVSFLNEVLDALEWGGTVRPDISDWMQRRWKFRFPLDEFTSWGSLRRLAPWDAVNLYAMPHEALVGDQWPDFDRTRFVREF